MRQVEALYGPTRWRRDEWNGASEIPATKRSSPSRQRMQSSLSSLTLRTVLALGLALFSWYSAFGDRGALEQAVALALRAAGIVHATPAPAETAEYFLASQTVLIGEAFPPSDAVVRQLKELLDQMAPKCKEDRFELAGAVVAAHNALAARGAERSAISILTQANSTLSDQTRQAWPTNCIDAINRVAARLRSSGRAGGRARAPSAFRTITGSRLILSLSRESMGPLAPRTVPHVTDVLIQIP